MGHGISTVKKSVNRGYVTYVMLFEILIINFDSLILYFFRKSLKVLLQERMSLDRRRLEEGLLLYWCLQRTQEYNLESMRGMAEVDRRVFR